jgi:hypothetical protein
MTETYKLITSTTKQTASAERRLEPRIQTKIQSELTGIDRVGRLFSTEITIEDMNELGCRFECGISLEAGDLVAIQPLEQDRGGADVPEPQLFEVTWTNRRVAFWTVGAMKLQGEKLAQINFPVARISSRHPAK